MARYIDAEKIINDWIKEAARGTDAERPRSWRQAYKSFIDELKVAPVVHTECIEDGYQDGASVCSYYDMQCESKSRYCPYCGMPCEPEWRYCPNCGSKRDEGEENGEVC